MVAAVGAKSTWGSPSSPQSGKPGGTGSSSNLGKTTKAKSKGTRTSKLKKAGSSTSKANAASVPAAISNGSSSAAKEGSTLKGKKVAGDTMRSRRGSDAVREPDSSRNAMGGLLPKIKTREFGPLSQLSSTLSMTASALSQRALENLAMFLSDPALTAFAKSSTPPVIEESSTNIVSTLAISSGSIPLSFVNQQRPLTPSSQPSATPKSVCSLCAIIWIFPIFPIDANANLLP
ncbi:hypothetical protein BC829DRAFT_89944 [Chytridium lagenaria]|nr:hypothetical protein BC829DRAFT_89944 [Chytridium lagenaria]